MNTVSLPEGYHQPVDLKTMVPASVKPDDITRTINTLLPLLLVLGMANKLINKTHL